MVYSFLGGGHRKSCTAKRDLLLIFKISGVNDTLQSTLYNLRPLFLLCLKVFESVENLPDIFGRLDHTVHGGTISVLKWQKSVSQALSFYPEFVQVQRRVWKFVDTCEGTIVAKRVSHKGARIPKTRLDKNSSQGAGGLPKVSNS